MPCKRCFLLAGLQNTTFIHQKTTVIVRIVTLTLNPALDKSTSVDRFIPEQKLRCAPMRIDAGGGGINVSKGIARLGGKSLAIFPTGGMNGQMLRALVEREGIETATIETQAPTRENFSVIEADSNVQYRFTLPGEPLSEKEIEACLSAAWAANPEFLVVSGSLPPGMSDDYFGRIARAANERKCKLILDTSGPALEAATHVGVYMLKPNLAELSTLAGVEELEINHVDDAALKIINEGKCEVVVVSLGPQGALLVTKSGFEHIPAPMVKKKSTVGAGDSMVSGIVWALGEDQSLQVAVQTGVACGSAATLNAGTELFHQEDVIRLLQWIRQYGDRYRINDFFNE